MNGAVIVAAGMSTRMGEFKPLMKIGNMTIIERIISTLKAAEIDHIVIVTGNQGKILEDYLKNQGMTFLRNDDYASTQMIDSAKIGFEYLKNQCEKIIFTPVDIPLYTSQTVKKLLMSKADVAFPVYNGKKGHPLFLNQAILPTILNYQGDNGLKGALALIGNKEFIEVDDQGILYDADTKQDYENLLRVHNHQLYRPDVKVSLRMEDIFMDEQTAQLLYLIDIMGSIRDACLKMNISYSKGIKMINILEQQTQYQLVVRKVGGAQGGYTYLTDQGHEFLRQYRKYEKELNEKAQELFDIYFKNILLIKGKGNYGKKSKDV